MERLTERFENGQAAVLGCGNNCKYDYKYCNNHLKDCPTITEIYEKLAAYEDAEEQGLLLRLPCKVGDTAWYVCRSGMYEVEIDSFVVNINLFVNVSYYIGCERFGKTLTPYKTLFFTREEAKAKLKEMNCFQNGNS